MNNLIIGVSKGYTYDNLVPFLQSLEEINFKGEVCLFVSEMDAEGMAKLRRHQVTLIPFNVRRINIGYKYVWPYSIITKTMNSAIGFFPINRLIGHTINLISGAFSKRRQSVRNRLLSNIVNVHCLRYILYQDFLRENPDRFENVMMTDVRDVIFQRDPFDFDIGDSLCCFLEDEREKIKDSEGTRNWIVSGFSKEAALSIDENIVSCSGVTIGKYGAVMSYLEEFIKELMMVRTHPHGLDQGIHNYLIYNHRLKDLKMYSNGLGPVLTMQQSMDIPLEFNVEGLVKNYDGSVPNVLHQYDRYVFWGDLAVSLADKKVRLVSKKDFVGEFEAVLHPII